MKLRPFDLVKSEPIQANLGIGGKNVMPIRAPSADSHTEQLMPYEKAAKAIYVRANGLPAYHRATGQARHFSDGGEGETK